MNNFLGQTNAKHGIFRFSLNDEYIGNALNEYGEFSEIEFSIMNKFIEKDDVVFDIGSNIGAFTIPFAKKLDQKEKFLPSNLSRLFTIYLKIMSN